MISNTYICDGCEKKMDEHEISSSISQSVRHAEGLKAAGKDFAHVWNVVPQFHFCHVCQLSAEDYWTQYPDFYATILAEVSQRITKNRVSFFQSRKAKARSGNLRAVQ